MRGKFMATLCLPLALGCKPASRPAPAPAQQSIVPAASPLGWRCPPGAARCIDRADLSAPFDCTSARCLQTHPVMPDDGEWTCGETAGVTLCTGGEAAAGVAPAGIAPGWVCGDRRGKQGDRVCRDASPDFPDGKPTGWRCFYGGPALPQRECVHDTQNHVVGDACDARNPCVDGALCREGVCVLPHRVPTCWVDADCGDSACRFGNCPGDPALAEPARPAPAAASRPPPPPLPALDFGPPQGQVGFDSEFAVTVEVRTGARPARITWRQIDGPALPELRVSEDGFRLSGRTVSWRTALGTEDPPWGVVPISLPRRGVAQLEATWQDPDGGTRHQGVLIAAAAVARGLTTVPVGARLYLGGEGWRVDRAADGGHATLEEHDGLTGLLPNVPGVWRLRDGKGRVLDLIAGRYEDVPLDCSRAGCHAEMLAGSLASPMTTVMARLLEAFPEPVPSCYRDAGSLYPGCALVCHATGQPDIADGGFHDVALAMGRTGHEPTRWQDLPRMLRRLGGAGCLSCHGPGAIPDPRASWTTLRSDVCAICHDAPPNQRHMAAWRSSANARADRDPDAASKPECARCHTTWGFLLAEKPQQAKNQAAAASHDHLTFMASLRPPAQAGPIGIACAACHDSHPAVDAGGQTPHALLRKVEHPRLLPALSAANARRSEICLPCHTPDLTRGTAPFASAAAIWLGRGGLDPATGAALEGPAPLAEVEGGCLHCHTGNVHPLAKVLGLPREAFGDNHTFTADRKTYPGGPGPELMHPAGIQRRARQLYLDAKLYRVLGDVRPLHASKTTLRRDTPAGRALWNLLLLLEDKAAEIHNPPYAWALLESAESALRPRAAARELAGGRR